MLEVTQEMIVAHLRGNSEITAQGGDGQDFYFGIGGIYMDADTAAELLEPEDYYPGRNHHYKYLTQPGITKLLKKRTFWVDEEDLPATRQEELEALGFASEHEAAEHAKFLQACQDAAGRDFANNPTLFR